MTEDEKKSVIQEVLNRIKSDSQSVDELETVSTLDGVNSLPAMRGQEVVSAPISLLSKPAEDAAKTANASATKADNAAAKAAEATNAANSAAATANEKAGIAAVAAQDAHDSASNASAVIYKYESTALAALKGATARFEAIVEIGTVLQMSTVQTGGRVVYLRSARNFVYEANGKYYNNWSVDGIASAALYHGDDLSLLKDKTYIMGDSLYVWSEEEGDLVEISGSGDGNTLNVTEAYPLSSGYYTLATAIAAVDEKQRGKGRCITYEVSQGKWETRQFTGTSTDSWTQAASWEDFGGAGTMKSLTVNGEKKMPDSEGNVSLNIEQVEVDESLDADSTNPVQNAAVSSKVAELEAGTLFGSEVVENDDNTVTVQLKSKSATITEFTIPAGGGGGGDDSSTTKIVLGASMDATTIKEGGEAKLTWTYDHQYAGGDEKGESTGQKATVTITVKRGATTTYSETRQEVSKGSYTVDLTKYLLLGTSDIYVSAETTDPNTGKTQKKQAYVSVKVVTLSLSSSYNIATGLANGGYGTTETVEIPYAVTGTGAKTVAMYVDGAQRNAHTVTRSGTTNSTFNLDMSGLSIGRHTVQMVAEMETDGLTLKSESVYFDIFKRGSNSSFVGVKIVHSDGRIVTGTGHTVPVIEVGQYEKCEFDFVAYDPAVTPATVEILKNDKPIRSVNVPRTAQTYSDRFTEKGRHELQLRLGTTSYTLQIDVAESGIDISEATYGLQLKLDAGGRSNGESNPGVWESDGVQTTFEGMDWSSNGWIDNTLKLTNGAKASIGYKPFSTDVKTTGMTLEITMRVTNVMDRNAPVVSCIDNGKGLLVTTQEASFKTGQTVSYTNEDDQQVTREIKLSTNYAAGEWMKVALMIGTPSDDRLMLLYINGNRTGADLYDGTFNFQQDAPQSITIDSSEADVEIKSIRVYNRALTDDEELENRMVDSATTDEMMEIFTENNILGDTGDVDMDKLLAKGKGVLRIVRKNKLDDVYAENNKKTDFLADIYYYSALGREYDFVLTGCYIRIQGTSSTKYPSKNIRIYCTKGSELLLMSGDKVTDGNKYQMRPGAIPMSLFCCKSDYSDSSMSLNTGGAKLFNDVMKELGLLTPPQRHQYEQGGSLNAVTVRSAIDGMPIDIFCAETADGENTYYGQYNFNNEKAKSGALFGMEGVNGYTAECPVTLEMLNNTSPVCLFQTTSDAQLAQDFDAGAEVNYGIDAAGKVQSDGDVTWSGLDTAQQDALIRLYSWIRACVPSGANADDLSTFKSEKFRNEIDQYFDKDFILTYYLFTDYFLSVDQRAKNMMLRSWDGNKWYITYYDGDTQLGKRNDCFLVYLYTTDRDTWDAEASKYAFEGHDSWLWNLVLANLEDDLKRCAASFRAVMTNERVLSMLNDEQSGNWSDRAFNKSGYLKYIAPATREMYGKVWPFIYALQGSNKSHRTFFIQNRFALLDAKYGTSNFTSDNIDLYMARTAGDAADVLRITANEVYAFGYGTNNSPNIAGTGIMDEDETATLSITGAYTVNDPLRIYGASRMKVLDMTGAADHLKNALDLGKCTVLRELNLQAAQGAGSTGWWLSISSCRQLRKLNVRNQSQAKTGGSTSTALDLTNQTKLEELDARGTNVQSVMFAKGAPVTSAYLPGTLTTLKLEYLNKLTIGGLSLETYGNVKTLIFDNCPNLNWETLLARCANVNRLRVTGIDREDDGTWLNKFMSIGGVDADGNFTDTCALVGTINLTKYIDDAEYEKLKAHFPELNILQPEYTTIKFDDSVSDSANISNLDNSTGYDFDKKYIPSGHITKILSQRYRCLMKKTGVGEVTIFPLHDENSNYFADADNLANATPAILTGEQGDVMLKEPHYWYKGINDLLNKAKYSCMSANEKCPTSAEIKKIEIADLTVKKGYAIRSSVEYATIAEAEAAVSVDSYCMVNIQGYKQVRYPSLSSALYGAVMIDANGQIVKRMKVTSDSGIIDGMYCFTDIPSNAVTLAFTISNAAPFDYVLLTKSDKIEAIEPDWVEHKECLVGVYEALLRDDFLYSISGVVSTASVTCPDFKVYARNRGTGFQLVDYEMHKDIGNLFYAKYGERDSQGVCGPGTHVNNRKNGASDATGMQDTKPTAQDGDAQPTISGDYYPNANAYVLKNPDDEKRTAIASPVCMGYENWYGNKAEWMEIDFNREKVDYIWRSPMPDGTEREIQGPKQSGDLWPKCVIHGRFMDILVSLSGGSSSSNYYDKCTQGSSTARVVFRSSSYANAYGGVACASASSDSAYVNANIGSRLAFRGIIKIASSASEFKAIQAA